MIPLCRVPLLSWGILEFLIPLSSEFEGVFFAMFLNGNPCSPHCSSAIKGRDDIIWMECANWFAPLIMVYHETLNALFPRIRAACVGTDATDDAFRTGLSNLDFLVVPPFNRSVSRIRFCVILVQGKERGIGLLFPLNTNIVTIDPFFRISDTSDIFHHLLTFSCHLFFRVLFISSVLLSSLCMMLCYLLFIVQCIILYYIILHHIILYSILLYDMFFM